MKVFKPRRGKRSTAISKSIVLQDGEIFFEVPSEGVGKGKGKIIMGDGIRSYEDLPVFLETGSGEGGGLAPNNISNISIIPGNQSLTIKWSDPLDTIIDGQTLCTWSGTKLVMKTSGYPSNEDDGTLIVDNTIRNQYKTSGYEITGLTNDTTYYFQLFPYSDQDTINRNTINRISGMPTNNIQITLTLYGANSDIITIKDSNNTTVGTCTFASGETSGTCKIPKLSSPTLYTFISSVAQIKQNNEWVYYSKTAVIDDTQNQTVDVYPEGAVYWYGNFINCTTYELNENTYTRDPSISQITTNTNSVNITRRSNIYAYGLMTSNPINPNSAHAIIDCTQNMAVVRLTRSESDETRSGDADIWASYTTTFSKEQVSGDGIGFAYYQMAYYNSSGNIYALWYDMPETINITLNGAKNDIITVKDSNDKTVAICEFESGETSGTCKIPKPSSSTLYTFISGVAQINVNDSWIYYSKTVAIDDTSNQTINIYPNYTSYWYGNEINAWSPSKYGSGVATKYDNCIRLINNNAGQIAAYAISESIDLTNYSKIKCIYKCITPSDTAPGGALGYSTSSNVNHSYAAVFIGGNYSTTIPGSSNTYFETELPIQHDGSFIIKYGQSYYAGQFELYAIWLTKVVTLTINGAKNDIITVKDSNNNTVATCTFASGETSGTIQLEIPRGSDEYTFISSVAKDTTTGSSDYSKSVIINDESTNIVNVYPDGAYYWYGNEIDLSIAYIPNTVWIYEKPSWVTKNTNHLYVNFPTRDYSVAFTGRTPISGSGSISVKCRASGYFGGSGSAVASVTARKDVNDLSGYWSAYQIWLSPKGTNMPLAIYGASLAHDGTCYPNFSMGTGAGTGNTLSVYAIWVE